MDVQVFPAPGAGPVAAGGDRAVPSRFTALVDDPAQPYLIGLDVRVGVTGAEVLMLQLQWRNPAQIGGVKAEKLREVKLARALRQAVEAASVPREEIATGPLAGHFRVPGTPEGSAYGGPGIRLDGTPQRGGPGRGRTMTTDHLAKVAEVYRAAEPGGKPVEAVKQAFFTNRSTASRWVAQAREYGLLERPRRTRQEGN